MMGRKKKTEICDKDWISKLPDPLVRKILTHLPTKYAVRTSVLSTRWRSLWLWVPSLKLFSREFREFNDFVSFGNTFIDSKRDSCIQNLELEIDVMDVSYLKSWIDAWFKRKIRDLHVRCDLDEYFCKIPMNLYICETLVSLKLQWVTLPDAEFVSLPWLKTFHLIGVVYPNEATFESLVSSCAILEELEIKGCMNDNAIVFRVLSRSLKKLSISLHSRVDSLGAGVVIDAPQLRCLNISDSVSESFVVTSVGSNARLDLCLTFDSVVFDEASVLSRRSSIRGFLSGVSKVMDLTICTETFELLCIYSKQEPLPQFGYVSRLHISLRVTVLKSLPTFLESFPNLKSLILVCDDDYEKMNETSFSTVPECLPLSLEFVDFEIPISGHVGEMKLVRYFLENSAVLKKLTLTLEEYSVREKSTLKELLRTPRASTKCEVVVI